jgi:solute:Na+ symporter, SSS family
MLKFLPAGFVGLMVGGLIAANSSTILTHLNWGASYLVHDFYRRFIRRDASEQHYVAAGRIVTFVLFISSSLLVYLLDTAKDAFDVILQVGAGTGLLYLVRWFWWRVNAWCEVVAMLSSFAVSVAILVLAKNGVAMSTHVALLVTIAVTTVCWMATAWLGPETDRAVLVEFYRKVRPAGPGWEPIRRAAGLPAGASPDNIPLALLGWTAGCTAIWSALFTVGNVLYKRPGAAGLLFVIFVISAAVLARVTRTLWAEKSSARMESV